jgi:hypothetical protein
MHGFTGPSSKAVAVAPQQQRHTNPKGPKEILGLILGKVP